MKYHLIIIVVSAGRLPLLDRGLPQISPSRPILHHSHPWRSPTSPRSSNFALFRWRPTDATLPVRGRQARTFCRHQPETIPTAIKTLNNNSLEQRRRELQVIAKYSDLQSLNSEKKQKKVQSENLEILFVFKTPRGGKILMLLDSLKLYLFEAGLFTRCLSCLQQTAWRRIVFFLSFCNAAYEI